MATCIETIANGHILFVSADVGNHLEICAVGGNGESWYSVCLSKEDIKASVTGVPGSGEVVPTDIYNLGNAKSELPHT